MKRRHRVNRELLLPTQGRRPRRGFKVGLAIVATLGLSGALAIPIVAQGVEDRQGNIPVAIDTISDPSFFTGDVYVDEHAPLAVFGASGKKVAIDGRPIGMLDGAAEETSKESALLAGQVGQLGVLPGDLQLMHPVTTRRITSSYGWRKNPTGAGNQVHIGQDYGLACGSPVYAAEAGRVIVSGWHGHSGNRVTVDHGNNVHTGYSHNSKLLVKIGDEVDQGELLALVGTTGNSTGCHLHFEVIIDGRWHDPRNYLPGISGQPDAMVDSRRLTVKSYTAPEGRQGENGTESSSPHPSQDPDVVTPDDDTPVVPAPKPTTKPSPSSPQPSPTETPTDPSPSITPSEPTPTAPETTEPDPSEDESSPSPSDDNTAEPTAPESSVDPSPQESTTPKASGSPTEGASPSKDSSPSESASPTGSQGPEDSASPRSSKEPSTEPSSSQSHRSTSQEPSSSPSATATHPQRSSAPRPYSTRG